MAEPKEILLERDDVGIYLLDDLECEDCDEPATHGISIDFRSAGEVLTTGRYCRTHAQERADRFSSGIREENTNG